MGGVDEAGRPLGVACPALPAPLHATSCAPLPLPQVQAARPDHGEVPKALARLYHRVGQAPRAVALLQAHIAAYPAQAGAGAARISWSVRERPRRRQRPAGAVRCRSGAVPQPT